MLYVKEDPRFPLPPVLRSRADLEAAGVKFAPSIAVPAELPIRCDGATYNMAQTAVWVDDQHFAVGRWDGSLSIFAFDRSPDSGPDITAAVSSPAMEGVQMVAVLTAGILATTNDEESLSIWETPSGVWSDLRRVRSLAFDPSFGPATSGTVAQGQQALILVVGHAGGFVTIWEGSTGVTDLTLRRAVDVRAREPVNPWGMHHVRGLAWAEVAGAAAIITGSEDGDLCVVRVSNGTILARTAYNPAAQRGINSIASRGQDLLVANCAVGEDDRNLWHFQLDEAGPSLQNRGSVNLIVAPNAPQVFNFCVTWADSNAGPCFFASTGEGELWMGTVQDGVISLLGHDNVTSHLGAALAFADDGRLVLAAHDLYEFNTLA